MHCTKLTKKEISFNVDGKKIKLLRVEQGFTLKELSEVSGVTRKTIGEIENGKKKKIRYSTIEQIANSLEKHVDYLCTQIEILPKSRGVDLNEF